MEIVRYVNKAMIYRLKNHRTTLQDFIELADDTPQEISYNQDVYFVRCTPIKITIPLEDK